MLHVHLPTYDKDNPSSLYVKGMYHEMIFELEDNRDKLIKEHFVNEELFKTYTDKISLLDEKYITCLNEQLTICQYANMENQFYVKQISQQ